MIKPDYELAEKLSGTYSHVPVYMELNADVITPIAILRKMSQISRDYYLLESVEGGEKWARYSFLGYDPLIKVTCKNGIVRIKGNINKTINTDKPLDVLRKILSEYKTPVLDDMPPFTGGFVGYFSYGLIRYAEPKLKMRESEFNDYDLMLFNKVIAYDHLKQKLIIIANIPAANISENYEKAVGELKKIKNMIFDDAPCATLQVKSDPNFTCNMTKEEFCKIINKAKEYIKQGDIFQVVLSRRFETEYKDSLINAYRVLRISNPSPYMFFIQTGNTQLAGTSPETLVKLYNNHLYTFPVAGSRPRGRTVDEDKELEQDLLQDEKELAEHNMLVDLARNDLGRICRFSTVHVSKYKMVHRYSKVMHLTSIVEGEMAEKYDALDAISAVLPAGTLSGAPKIRACEIIDELEKSPRGIYGGAIGYIDFSGNMDTCIAIRMAVKKDEKVYVQAGAGIVADSVPEREYEESENKAGAIIDAIKNACEVNDP